MNLSWLLLAATTVVVSQTPGRPPEELACRQAQPANPMLTKTISNGAVVTVRSVTPNGLGQTCEVTVRDRNGKVVFEDRGFNTSIDPATGRDIDNDGQPDAVVGIDTMGGTGNWEYPIVSLSPPRVLVKLPQATFDFQTRPGKTLIWTSATFDGFSQSAADAPSVATAHEFRPNGFIDVTSDYCKALLAGELVGLGNLRGPLAVLSRQAKVDSRTGAGRYEDREDTRVAATTVALQQIYCGQVDEASRLILEVWPASDQSRIRREIKAAISDRWSEMAKRLAAWN